MILDKSGVILALSALGEHLEQVSGNAVELVVCGGSALQALGLIERTTRDVDVLAVIAKQVADDVVLLSAQPLPKTVVDAAAIVARDFGLPTDWLNPGPTELLSEGLPDGLVTRLHSMSFGSKLTVHFIDRFDQICLKMYATINGGGPRHLADLQLLKPSDDEVLIAARWCLTQDASEVFPDLVCSFLQKVGYPDVVEKLKTDS